MEIINLTNWELWLLAIAGLLACYLAGRIAQKDMQTRMLSGKINPADHEPILWAEPGSWWKVPAYRIQKFLFVDCVSTAGAFAGIMTWIWIRQYEDLAKTSVWATLCVTALFLLAWTNLALPKYRPQFVDAILSLIKAFASAIAGRWNPQSISQGSSVTTQSSSVTQNSPVVTQLSSTTVTNASSDDTPIPIDPRMKNG